MNKVFLVLLAAFLVLTAGALAAESMDANRDVSLSFIFRHEGRGLPDGEFSVYRVADVDQTGKVTMVAPFDKYHVNIDLQSESAMAGVAATLEGYALRDQLAPDYFALTDMTGTAVVSGEKKLEQGLYLVTAYPLYCGWPDLYYSAFHGSIAHLGCGH